jgi:pyruvate, water dikinase
MVERENADLLWMDQVDINDKSLVGGKNASLGEMYQNLTSRGIKIPFGFIVTSNSYKSFINFNNLEEVISMELKNIDYNDTISLKRVGIKIRTEIQNGDFPESINHEICKFYKELSEKYYDVEGNPQTYTDVAVRSSGTAEDMPDASFAGQQETYLNVRGKQNVLESIRNCFASLYTDRAISYRKSMGYMTDINISVCVQKMVRSDLGSSGVAFSLDPESGFKDVILINSSWGLGEMVVGGCIQPDEIVVFKKTLNEGYFPIIDKKLGLKMQKMIYGINLDQKTKIVSVDFSKQSIFSINKIQILKLSKWVIEIENYYTNILSKWTPLDIEWAIDGLSGELYIVQARPETIHSRRNLNTIKEYKLIKSPTIKPILTGIAVGNNIGKGKIKIIYTMDSRDGSNGLENFKKGDILVTDMTDPDWEPIMKMSSGIITNKGGRVCHASIVARELNIPAIVGTENGTQILKNDQEITLSCGEGETGYIYEGNIPSEIIEINIDELPQVKTKVMLNVGSPENAFASSFLPNSGVGLAREEFIINNFVGIHPMALLKHNSLNDPELTTEILSRIKGFKNEINFYVNKLSYGIARIATAFYPKPVIVRFSDFKSNEYSNLLGGKYFEPHEENPMIGWRGASRYYSPKFKEAFLLECKAIKEVREIMGLKNVIVMIPFCRTVGECKKVLEVMKEGGLERGIEGLQVYLMCEVPSNVILAKDFCKLVDGFSIGSNDLTQLTLGIDRDSELIAHIYDERNEAVKSLIKNVIEVCHENNTKIGICGQGPSDFPDFAKFLIENGIDSVSVTPDSLPKTLFVVKDAENNKISE